MSGDEYPRVVSVARSSVHEFSKQPMERITLLRGLGVEGDSHAGGTVQHLSRVARDPSQPNLRQVHLVRTELLDELAARGFAVAPGIVGENVTTGGLDLITLPRGTRLLLGAHAVIEITGLRNPCLQLDKYQRGLLKAMLDRAADGGLVRLTGVMAVVLIGGEVSVGDRIDVELPVGPHTVLQPV